MFSVLFQTMASAERIQCSVCFHPFDDQNICPRNLSCGHSFCTGCLERLLAKFFLEWGANLDGCHLKNTQVGGGGGGGPQKKYPRAPPPPPPPPGDEIPLCDHLNMFSGELDFFSTKIKIKLKFLPLSQHAFWLLQVGELFAMCCPR